MVGIWAGFRNSRYPWSGNPLISIAIQQKQPLGILISKIQMNAPLFYGDFKPLLSNKLTKRENKEWTRCKLQCRENHWL